MCFFSVSLVLGHAASSVVFSLIINTLDRTVETNKEQMLTQLLLFVGVLLPAPSFLISPV